MENISNIVSRTEFPDIKISSFCTKEKRQGNNSCNIRLFQSSFQKRAVSPLPILNAAIPLKIGESFMNDFHQKDPQALKSRGIIYYDNNQSK
jgi:hypothetical protein